MYGWKMTPAKSRWSRNSEQFAWNLNDGASFGRVENGLPSPALTDDQKAQLYKSVALTHPEDFDFCCESAVILDGLKDCADDAALIRRDSLRLWKPTRATALQNSVYGEIDGIAIDSAFKMALTLLQYYDQRGMVADATETARLLWRITFCDVSKGARAKTGRAARLSYIGWLRAMLESARTLCLKYGVELVANDAQNA